MIASGNHTIIYAAPVRTLGLRGSELLQFEHLRWTALYNPSVSCAASSLYTREPGGGAHAPGKVTLCLFFCFQAFVQLFLNPLLYQCGQLRGLHTGVFLGGDGLQIVRLDGHRLAARLIEHL